jgi:hypothetical protein
MKNRPDRNGLMKNCTIGCIVNCIINCMVNPKRLAGIRRCVRFDMYSTGKALETRSEALAG